MAVILKCKMCGGDLNAPEGAKVVQCEFCGTQQTIPSVDDERKANLFNRANSLRSANEFDRAIGIYESIVNEFPEEAEAYWGLVLCKYGIEYVDDPVTHRKVPTCHRTSYESVFDDVNYKQAMSFADPVAKDVYRSEAEAVNEIQKGILSIAKNEKPFDVFICYKESDDLGRRTPDSVLAQDIYYELQRDGFKVFFSRITLEGKLGTAYEPYIFAALNSAKVMVVVGTKPEYYNAVWVKNEWSRFLDMMKKDKSKVIIPAYKDMDPYDLPDALSMFQAQDMGKLGFMQDLIRGITKLVHKDEEKPVQTVIQQTVAAPAAGSNVENLLKRGFMALEDGKWSEADSFFEQVLNENVEEPRAYLGKLMAELHYTDERKFDIGTKYISANENFKKAFRFGDDDFKEKLNQYSSASVYNNAFLEMKRSEEESNPINAIETLKEAIDLYNTVLDYNNAKEKISECEEKISRLTEVMYCFACNTIDNSYDFMGFNTAKSYLEYISNYKDAKAKISELNETVDKLIKYKDAQAQYNSAKSANVYIIAANMFKDLEDFRDASEKEKACYDEIEKIKSIETEKIYLDACKDMKKDGEYVLLDVIEKFNRISGYKDADEKKKECEEKLKRIKAEIKAEQSKKLKIKIGICAAIVIAIIVAVAYKTVIKPTMEYKKAVQLYESGSYYKAMAAFKALDDYEDRKEKIEEVIIKHCNELIDSNLYGEVNSCLLLTNFDDTKESELLNSVVTRCDETIQQQIMESEQYGKVYFGSYDGKLLSWTVLSKDEEKVLVICDLSITRQKFNSGDNIGCSWENSPIRNFLNDGARLDSFINTAFTSAGRQFIMPVSISNYDSAKGTYNTFDNIFLLDENEYNMYKGYIPTNQPSWLRTSYSTSGESSGFYNNSVYQYNQYTGNYIYPAMYIKLN